jgi:hypothetical protein
VSDLGVWPTVFLGVIALATATMAVIQALVIVYGARLARRVDQLADQVEREIKPALATLNAVAQDASRASALAAAQMERIDQLIGSLSARIDETAATAQHLVLAPLREGAALVRALQAMLAVLRGRSPGERRPPTRVEGEDALFIG